MYSPYTRFHQSATGVAFPLGPCDAIYVKATITTNDLVMTLVDGTTVNFGLVPNGTTIVGQFTMATYAGGPANAVVACYYATRLEKTQLA